ELDAARAQRVGHVHRNARREPRPGSVDRGHGAIVAAADRRRDSRGRVCYAVELQMAISDPAETKRAFAAKHQPADFVRIAHRGASAECPENTLAAFRQALKLGAQMIECDLQLTADGHVVVIHDWTLTRTTNGSGAVRDLPLAAIRGLDAGSWRDA